VYVAANDNSIVGAIVRATVAGDTVSASDLIDVPNSGTFIAGIAQAPNGDIWATNTGCTTSLVIRLHVAAGFAPSSISTYPTPAGCEEPEFLTALPDGSLWVPESAGATITQVIPGTSGPPSMFDLPFPSPHSILGVGYDSTIGPNGNVYVTNFNQNKAGFSSNVIEVAY
jgi:streptogramin lyase